jgi:DNA-binding transcriptional regulator YiaG
MARGNGLFPEEKAVFAAEVRKFRTDYCLTQLQLSNLLNLEVTSIRNFERQRCGPSRVNMAKFFDLKRSFKQ